MTTTTSLQHQTTSCPPETAGSLVERAVPTAAPTDTVRGVLAELQALSTTYSSIDYIYITEDALLVGVMSIHELLQAKPDAVLRSVMTTPVVHVHTHTDQEKIAAIALAQSIKAVPVVDRDGQFVGAVSADTILRILREEHTEDVLTMAGLVVEPGTPLRTLSNLQHIKSRLPWLLLGLAGGFAAAVIVEAFTGVLEAHLILAAFIPAIVYLADAVGSQTQMVYIRALTIGQSRALLDTLRQEGVVAAVIGIVLAGITWLGTWWWVGELVVSHILALAIIGTVYCSVMIGIVLPWAFHRFGADPAVASGPLATVIRDVLSLCIYLVIASLLL